MTNVAYEFDAVDPANIKERMSVRVEHSHFNFWHKYRYLKCLNLWAAKQVLANPTRIFIGIRRAFDQNGWCYVGKPATWFVREDAEINFPKDLVYMVFVNERKSLFDHYAEDCDILDQSSPADWENRFGDVIRVRS